MHIDQAMRATRGTSHDYSRGFAAATSNNLLAVTARQTNAARRLLVTTTIHIAFPGEKEAIKFKLRWGNACEWHQETKNCAYFCVEIFSHSLSRDARASEIFIFLKFTIFC